MIEFYIRKVKFNIEFGFLAVVALLCILDDGRYLLYGVWACIIHEVGHIVPMLLLGEKVKKVKFHAFGVNISPQNNTIRPLYQDVFIILGGAIINIILGLIVYFSDIGTNAYIFASMNIILGLFNLLPYTSFDGGTLILTVAEYFNGDTVEIKKILRIVNCILSIALIGFLITNHINNITLVITISYLILIEIIGSS
ncbi:MAG: hypothetical protein GX365_00625 [Clostridiales bacterium]|nr:hypothetical protein [Clostridiales bacterium]